MTHIIRTATIAIVVFACLAHSTATAARVPTAQADSSVSSRCRLRVYKGPRNYGPLGNLIARLFDKAPAAETSKSLPPTAEPSRTHNYGPLGNLIAWLFEKAPSDLAASEGARSELSSGTRLLGSVGGSASSPSSGSAGGTTIVKQPRQYNYGPLGNLIARLLDRAFGKSEKLESPKMVSPSPGINSERPAAPQPKTPTEVEAKPNKALQSVRELVKLLSSNFLQDSTFVQAAEALKQLDQGLGIDAAPGAGGFLTAAERERLLLRAQEASGSLSFSTY